MPIRTLIADDHALIRQALRYILENHAHFEFVAECGSGIEAVELARQQKPDIAIIDVAMKPLNGIEAAPQIREVSPQTKILIVSMHCDERYVARAIKAGASGYVVKTSAVNELIYAIHEVRDGQMYFSADVGRSARMGPDSGPNDVRHRDPGNWRLRQESRLPR